MTVDVQTGGRRLRGLFNRRAAVTLLCVTLLLGAAILVNLVGIRLAGSVESWQLWMTEHAAYFLVWRLLLYTGTAGGWIWMRRRLLAREPGLDARQRLLRVEIAAVLAVAALEVSPLFMNG